MASTTSPAATLASDANHVASVGQQPATAEQPKIVLYWLEQSRSQRILWLLEELKVPYELQVFHRNPKTKLAGPELKKVHALGKSPVISITPAGSTEATLIAESGFITEYLTEHFGDKSAGSVLPKRWKDGQEGKVCGETEEWMRYKYFLHYAEGSLMTLMLLSLVALQIKAAPGAPFFVKPITNRISKQLFDSFIGPNVKTHFEFLEGNLRTAVASESGKRYLCGPNLTAADILMSFPLIAAKGGRAGAIDKATYPLLVEYIATLEGEAGYKKSIDKIIEVEGHFDASL